MKYIKIKQAIECPDIKTVKEPNNKSNNPGFEHFCRILFFICETCQWLKFPLNGLRAQSRVSPVVGTGRRNHGRTLKRLLDTWDRNRSTSGPTSWKIYDDNDFSLLKKESRLIFFVVGFHKLLNAIIPSWLKCATTPCCWFFCFQAAPYIPELNLNSYVSKIYEQYTVREQLKTYLHCETVR